MRNVVPCSVSSDVIVLLEWENFVLVPLVRFRQQGRLSEGGCREQQLNGPVSQHAYLFKNFNYTQLDLL